MKKLLSMLVCLVMILSLGGAVAEGGQRAFDVQLEQITLLNKNYSASWVEDENLLLVNTRDSGYQVMTPEGEVVFTADSAKVSYQKYGYYITIQDSGLNMCGLLNSKGEQVVPFAYSDFEIISEQYCIAVSLESTTDDAYDYASGFFGSGDDHYNVVAYDLYDLIAKEKIGTLARSDFQRDILPLHDGFLIESRSGVVKAYDLSLNYIKDVEGSFYSQDYFYNTSSGIYKSGVTDDQQLVLDGYKMISQHTDNVYSIRSLYNDMYGAMDKEGNIVVPAEYTEIRYAEGEYVIVGMGNYDNRVYGVYHIGEGLVVPCEYAEFKRANSTYFTNGYIMYNEDGKLGYVSLKGEVTSPAKYKEDIITKLGVSYHVADLEGNYILVTADGTQTVVDYASLEKYGNYSDGLLIKAENKEGKTGYINCYGEELTPFDGSFDYARFSYTGEYVLFDNAVYKIK